MINLIKLPKAELDNLLSSLFPRSSFKTSFSRNQYGRLLKEGWKYCSNCNYVLKTPEGFCVVCGKKLRSTIREKTNVVHKYAEPRTKAEILALGKGF